MGNPRGKPPTLIILMASIVGKDCLLQWKRDLMAGFTGRSKEEEVILGIYYWCPRTRSEIVFSKCLLPVWYVAASSFSSIGRWVCKHTCMLIYVRIHMFMFKNVKILTYTCISTIWLLLSEKSKKKVRISQSKWL